jgi:hypothetical protein
VVAAAHEEAKNKPKTSADASSLATPAKRCRSSPLGSKNKKASTSMANVADHLDVSLAQPILPSHLWGICSPFLLLLAPNAMSNSASL